MINSEYCKYNHEKVSQIGDLVGKKINVMNDVKISPRNKKKSLLKKLYHKIIRFRAKTIKGHIVTFYNTTCLLHISCNKEFRKAQILLNGNAKNIFDFKRITK